MRPTLHTPALFAIAALPLLLTTSQVEAEPTAAEVTTTTAADPASARPAGLPPRADESAAADVASADVPARAALGDTGNPDELPWVALQAYKRAADILGEVDPSCGITWSLLAAVGQVESDHGRAGGAQLGDDGVVHPAIVGEGPGAAVGPMQLLPAAWRMVGVDGDGDGTRSVQDLDDAAVAAGVYLCATGSGLGSPDAVEQALLAYNSSQEYVDQVVAALAHYRSGDYAVAEPPQPQTVDLMLDYGLGTPAEGRPTSPGEAREAAEKGAEYAARPAGKPTPAEDDGAPTLLPGAPSADPSDGLEVLDEPSLPVRPTPVSPSPVAPTGEPDEAPSESPSASSTEEPSESTSESTDESSDESPSGSAEPETVTAVGEWTECGETYCLEDMPLDLSAAGEPTDPAAADFDGDGTVATVSEELAGLVGQYVELSVVEYSEPLEVVELNRFALAPE